MSSSSWIGKDLGGRYHIEALLGQGGMSAVYKATDPNLNRSVALKLIHPHLSDIGEFVDRFREEATVVAQLRHPNIVQVFDFNRDGDDFYMVMEYVGGETLRARLDRLNSAGSRLPLVEAVTYAINICDAADYAHRRNVIHRDIKPANVMLSRQGQAVLMDFGIAKIMGGPKYTATGATMGTALYMPPEQIRGERVDERSDIYAMGVMLFEMIAGQPPYQAESPMTILMMHLGDPLPDLHQLRSECPADLKALVEKAVAKEPAQRFQHASEMSTALNQALGALQDSLQAPTEIGNAAAAVTTPPPQVKAAAVEATALSQTRPAAAATAPAPVSAPPQAYEPPQVVSDGRSNRKLMMTCGLLAAGAVVLIGGLLLVLFVLKPFDDGSEALAGMDLTDEAMLPPASTTTPADEPATLIAGSLTETPTPEAPTATPTTAPTATAEPSPTPSPPPIGSLAFLDNEESRAGSFELTISEAGTPAEGNHFELWLSDGQRPVPLGALTPGGDIDFAGEIGENLLANYNIAFITVEPDDQDSETPLGVPVFVGFVPAASLEQIRLLVASAPDTPGEKAYLVGAEEQARVAIDHGGFLADSLAAGDLATARQHAEHVVNTLVGEEGDAFGDLNGDGFAQNPGDGFGVAVYLEKAREHAQMAAEAEEASEAVKMHAGHTIIAVENSLEFLEQAVQQAGRVLASDSTDEALRSSEALSASLDALLNGVDANNDGVVAPSPKEGGILIAYEHALKMGSFEFFHAEDVASLIE